MLNVNGFIHKDCQITAMIEMFYRQWPEILKMTTGLELFDDSTIKGISAYQDFFLKKILKKRDWEVYKPLERTSK